MWILKYQYDTEDGNTTHISCCLKAGHKYSIGRSSKNQLLVKNDKSISREHVSFSWDLDKSCISLVNQGKLTVTGKKYLKVGERQTINPSAGAFEVHIGTKPIIISLKWQYMLWDIPREYSQLSSVLESLGIKLHSSITTTKNFPTLVIKSKSDGYTEHEWHKYFYCLAYNIPIADSFILPKLIELVSQKHTDFDEQWHKLSTNHITTQSDQQKINTDILKQYTVFLHASLSKFNVGNYITEAVHKLGGSHYYFDGEQTFSRQFQKCQKKNQLPILIDYETPSFAPENYGLQFQTIKSLVECVLNDNVSSLISNNNCITTTKQQHEDEPKLIPSKTTAAVISEEKHPSKESHIADREPSPVVAKRRRLGRNQVKPLDSLNFFVGGNIRKPDIATTFQTSEKPEKPSQHLPFPQEATPTPKANNDVLQSVLDKEEPAATSAMTNIQPLEGQQTIEENVSGISRIMPKRGFASADHNISNSTRPSRTPSMAAAAMSSNTTASRQKTLGEFRRTPGTKSSLNSDDLAQTVQDAKNREVQRLRSTVVQVDQVELTEEAINNLSNLVLVQDNGDLIRKNRNETNEPADNDPRWAGRKNFKKFVKILPKYMQLESSADSNPSRDFIRNNAFLITRNFVPLRIYDHGAHNSNDGDLFQFNNNIKHSNEISTPPAQANKANLDEVEQQSFSFSSNVPSNGLFVHEDDSSQEKENHPKTFATNDTPSSVSPPSAFEKANPTKRQYKRAAWNKASMSEDSDDDEDEDEGPKFKFRRSARH